MAWNLGGILLRISDSHMDITKILAGSEVTTKSYQGPDGKPNVRKRTEAEGQL